MFCITCQEFIHCILLQLKMSISNLGLLNLAIDIAVRKFLIAGAVLYIVGCLAASPVSPIRCQCTSPLCDKEKGLQILPHVPWWGNHPLLRTAGQTGLGLLHGSPFMCEVVPNLQPGHILPQKVTAVIHHCQFRLHRFGAPASILFAALEELEVKTLTKSLT